MALNKSMTLKSNFNQDIAFNNTYIKIDKLAGNKSAISVEVNVYDQKDGTVLQTGTRSFAPSLDGDNFIKQAYNHLKTLPEFVGASDC